MTSAGIQKLFCGIYSTFKCSFDEFVGENVFSPSYSSAILAPPPKFYFIFKLYIIVLVLPNIKMNLPQVYMCSSWIKAKEIPQILDMITVIKLQISQPVDYLKISFESSFRKMLFVREDFKAVLNSIYGVFLVIKENIDNN